MLARMADFSSGKDLSEHLNSMPSIDFMGWLRLRLFGVCWISLRLTRLRR